MEALYEFGGTILCREDIYKEEKKKREKETLNQTYGKYTIWSSFSSVYFLFCSQKYYITP